MISIGLGKEIREGERRVLLTPSEVREICQQSYPFYVETNAGIAAGYANDEYQQAGAAIVSKEELWQLSDIVLKFKCPQSCEYHYMREGQILGAFMHAEGNPDLVKAMCAKKVTAYAFEFFETKSGLFPMSFVDSEVAGKMAMIYGMYHLQSHLGGEGILLSPVIGVPLPVVVVIGYGNAGNAAIRVAEALGLEVYVFGRDKEKIRKYQSTVHSNVHCMVYTKELFEHYVTNADLVIGAIQISTYDTPAILTVDLVKKMKKGSMIVDVTCGYGEGYMPSFDRMSSFDAPVYEKFGVLHCKIDLLPAAVPLTTTIAVSKHITPYLLSWFNSILNGAIDTTSNSGLLVKDGIIRHTEIKRHMDFFGV